MRFLSPRLAATAVLALSGVGGAWAFSAGTPADPWQATGTESPGFTFTSSFGSSGGGIDTGGFTFDIGSIVGTANASQTFVLPSFSIAANPAYVLSNLRVTLGNFTFVDTVAPVTEISGGSGDGLVRLNGGAPTSLVLDPVFNDTLSNVPVGGGTVISLGTLHFVSRPSADPFTTLAFDNGMLTLEGVVSPSISSITPSEMRVSFQVSPVPEPGTWALMLAGLAAVGFVARRRRVA